MRLKSRCSPPKEPAKTHSRGWTPRVCGRCWGPHCFDSRTGAGAGRGAPEIVGNYPLSSLKKGYISYISGWWFGTWILFFHSFGNVIIPTDEFIFSEGVETTTFSHIFGLCACSVGGSDAPQVETTNQYIYIWANYKDLTVLPHWNHGSYGESSTNGRTIMVSEILWFFQIYRCHIYICHIIININIDIF